MRLLKGTWLLNLTLLYFLITSFSEDIRFRKIDMSSGLSYNSVMCVAEDHNGLMWIGTREGLNKYNSVDITIYKNKINDSLSLSNNHINCIYETSSNDLWVGTAKGLNRYDEAKDQFVQYLTGPDSLGLSNGYVKCISEGINNELWVGTSFGLNILNKQKNKFRQIFLEEFSSNNNNIIALFHDKQNRMWIGTRGGLFVYAQNRFKKVDIDSSLINSSDIFEIRDIKQDEEGLIWIATEENGIYAVNANNEDFTTLNHFEHNNSGILSNSVRKIFIDGNDLWLATLDGLSVFSKNTGDFLNFAYSQEKPEGVSNSSIHDVIKDRSGGFWLATYTGGVNYYHPQNNLFPHYTNIFGVSASVSSNAITGFLEDKQGNLFIATGDVGLYYIDSDTKKVTNYKAHETNGLSSNNIKSFDDDENGNLWIGTFNGLNFYDRQKNIFVSYFHDSDNPNSLNNNQVHAVLVDEEGLVWIGMNGGIFQVFNPKSQNFTNLPDVGTIVNEAIFEDSEGKLWIGERVGLKCMDRKSRKLVDISGLTAGFEEQLKYVNWISEDSSGRIWIATQSSGIIIFDKSSTFIFDTSNGLSDNSVNAILEDELGNFWISTNKGISKIKYVVDENGKPQIESTNFTSINGLQGAQFDSGSAYKGKSGKLYFGGINGYNVFMPGEVKKIDYFPPVVFAELQIISRKKSTDVINPDLKNLIFEDRKLDLKYSERNIFLRFAGINYVNPDETYYRYMLNDLDKNWIDLGKQRTINFTYLPVGKHELRIQSSTNPINWGNEYKKLTFQVFPPWWQTWWAFLIYASTVIFLLYLFFTISQRWAQLKNKLQMEQFEREKELELHESKLKFFTDVSHELRTPLTLILAPLEKMALQSGFNKQLALVQQNGKRMMQLIDQVLNLRKLETGHDKLQAAKGNIGTFLKEISLSFHEIASLRNIDFEFRSSPEKLSLWYDRDKMEIIVYNLLSNAFKNTSSGGKVSLLLSLEETKITGKQWANKEKVQYAKISVTDNGKGIAEDDLTHIYERFYSKKGSDSSIKGFGVGLELTKRMVELHKGKIQVESMQAKPDENGLTTFTVFLPIGNEHLADDEIVPDFKNSEDSSRYTRELQLREKLSGNISFDENIELPKISDKDKQTLLIVEDNAEVREFVRDLFLENYLTEEAENGLVGWHKVIQIIPDLIISDIMMPEMDGIELCRKLKSDIRTSHIPVVLLTARTTLTFKYEGLETGADEYITKPFSAQYLMLRVKNLIKQRDTLRNHFQRETILEPGKIAVTSVDERLLKKAVDYITENIENTSITVEQVSAELGLSRVHFYRKIKALTNLTAIDFIRSIRLKNAAMLLKQNKLSIKEVQNRVGFENADYFRKCFKEYFGVTPSAYANKNETTQT